MLPQSNSRPVIFQPIDPSFDFSPSLVAAIDPPILLAQSSLLYPSRTVHDPPSPVNIFQPFIMLSRQGLKLHRQKAFTALRIASSTRNASFANTDLLSILRPAANVGAANIPLHLLDEAPPGRSQEFRQLSPHNPPRSLAHSSKLSSNQTKKILAKDDESEPVDPPKVKRERKKRESPSTGKNEGGEPSEIENPETDKSKPTDSKSTPPSSQNPSSPAAPPSNDDSSPPPRPPRVKTPNDQKGSPTEKLYQVASAADKEKVMILPINRRPLIPGKLGTFSIERFLTLQASTRRLLFVIKTSFRLSRRSTTAISKTGVLACFSSKTATLILSKT